MQPSAASWRNEKRTSHERGYGAAWQRARRGFLMSHPLCVMCSAEGRTTAAEVVDHIQPHRGDQSLFWDQGNWQPLCKAHHDSDKARQEHGTRERAKFDAAGRVVW
jgi:5-methylcytosine-specific restriction endonuclease McrA